MGWRYYLYLYHRDNWTYLAIVMDLFDLKVVGWSYGLNMTEELVVDIFNKALVNRGLEKNGIFHSDRGSQYTFNDYESLLSTLEIKHSYSKKGCPYDNASMESLGAILKKEEVGELAKEIRKTEKNMDMELEKEYDSCLKYEIADVFIYLLAICNSYNINLLEAFKDKEKINLNRDWK